MVPEAIAGSQPAWEFSKNHIGWLNEHLSDAMPRVMIGMSRPDQRLIIDLARHRWMIVRCYGDFPLFFEDARQPWSVPMKNDFIRLLAPMPKPPRRMKYLFFPSLYMKPHLNYHNDW